MKINGFIKVGFFSLLVTIYCCHTKPSAINIKQTKPVDSISTDTTDTNQHGMPLDFKKIKIIDTLYVIDPSGAEVKSMPDISAKAIIDQGDPDFQKNGKPLKYDLGDHVLVIEKKGDWLGVVGVVSRPANLNGRESLSATTEEVFVRKNQIGKLTDIKVTYDALRILAPESGSDTNKRYLKGFIDLKLVTRSEYEEKKATAMDCLVTDTLNTKNKNGIIELPLKDGVKRFKDSGEGMNSVTHTYFGQFPFLNAYLVLSEYDATESGDYQLINKDNGSVLYKMALFPHISYDKKHLIGIGLNEYGTTAALSLYKIEGLKLKPTLEISFRDWLAAPDEKDKFWGSDGCFYLPIAHNVAASRGGPYEQYLKITVL